MERRIVKLARAGSSDESIADKLTAEGFRSPMRPRLIPSTVSVFRETVIMGELEKLR
jgi:hypothetical protein